MQRPFVYNRGNATKEKGRTMTGTYENGIYREGDVRLSDLSGRRRLPIGRDGFATAVQESVVIDKSLLIADVLNSSAAVTLFCRPRRFGKSLNMTMLKSFFEIPPGERPERRGRRLSLRGPFHLGRRRRSLSRASALIPLSTSASIR